MGHNGLGGGRYSASPLPQTGLGVLGLSEDNLKLHQMFFKYISIDIFILIMIFYLLFMLFIPMYIDSSVHKLINFIRSEYD